MTDDLTTFCHHVVWYYDPLTLYTHLGDREVVYLANNGNGLPEGARNVVAMHVACIDKMEPNWWNDGVCVDRPALPTAGMHAHKCLGCLQVIPEKYLLEIER